MPIVSCSKLCTNSASAPGFLLANIWLGGSSWGLARRQEGGWLKMLQPELDRQFLLLWRENLWSLNRRTKRGLKAVVAVIILPSYLLKSWSLTKILGLGQKFFSATWSERGRFPCSVSWLAPRGICCSMLWDSMHWSWAAAIYIYIEDLG